MCTNGNCSNTHVLTGDSLQHVNMHCAHSTASLLTWTVHTHKHTQVGAHTDLHSTWASTGERWGYTHSCSRATCSVLFHSSASTQALSWCQWRIIRDRSQIMVAVRRLFGNKLSPCIRNWKPWLTGAHRPVPPVSVSAPLSPPLCGSPVPSSLDPCHVSGLQSLFPKRSCSHTRVCQRQLGSSSPEYEKDSLLVHSLISLPH